MQLFCFLILDLPCLLLCVQFLYHIIFYSLFMSYYLLFTFCHVLVAFCVVLSCVHFLYSVHFQCHIIFCLLSVAYYLPFTFCVLSFIYFLCCIMFCSLSVLYYVHFLYCVILFSSYVVVRFVNLKKLGVIYSELFCVCFVYSVSLKVKSSLSENKLSCSLWLTVLLYAVAASCLSIF